jgi:hypothetical protein
VVLFGIVTLISLFIPSQIRLSKVITIRANRDSVFTIISKEDQWYRWHPAFTPGNPAKAAPAITTRIISENDSVLQMQWQQGKRTPVWNEWRLFSGTGEYASLQWSMMINTAWYPWEKIGVLMYEPTYGKMMEGGLANIKSELER